MKIQPSKKCWFLIDVLIEKLQNFRGKEVPLEPGVLEIILKDLHPEIKFPEILGPPQFSKFKVI